MKTPTGMLLKILNGETSHSKAKVSNYRRAFLAMGFEVSFAVSDRPLNRATTSRQTEPVGSFLTGRIDGLIGVKSGKGCNCKDLAQKMNSWGIAGCQKKKHRAEIIETLLKNRKILKVSLAKSAFSFGREAGVVESLKLAAQLTGDWWHGKGVSEEAFKAGANWLLDMAIEDTKKHVLATADRNSRDSFSETTLTTNPRRRRGKN